MRGFSATLGGCNVGRILGRDLRGFFCEVKGNLGDFAAGDLWDFSVRFGRPWGSFEDIFWNFSVKESVVFENFHQCVFTPTAT